MVFCGRKIIEVKGSKLGKFYLDRDKNSMKKHSNNEGLVDFEIGGADLISYTYVIGELSMEVVDAKGLHSFLDAQQPFEHWFSSRVDQYHFELGDDYFVTNVDQDGEIHTDSALYLLTLDMAKDLSMLECTPKGRQAKKYFVAFEKHLKEKQEMTLPDSLLAVETESYQWANAVVDSLQLKSKPVIVPAQEMNKLVQTLYLYKQQIESLKSPEWLEHSIERIEKYSNCSFKF